MITDDMRFRALKDRYDELVEENAWLKRELGIIQDAGVVTRLKDVFNLSGTEAKLLAAMHTRGGKTLTKDAAMNILYSDRPNDEPDRKIIDVYACKIRGKVRHVTGENAIGTEWGVGYFLTPEGIEAADRAMALEFSPPRTTARHGRREVAA